MPLWLAGTVAVAHNLESAIGNIAYDWASITVAAGLDGHASGCRPLRIRCSRCLRPLRQHRDRDGYPSYCDGYP